MIDPERYNAKILYVHDCSAGHRVVRHSPVAPAPCSRCGGFKPFYPVATVERFRGENHEAHMIRALAFKARSVN